MSIDARPPIQPGADGEPVPSERTVLRFGKPPQTALNDEASRRFREGKAWEGLFTFSSKERQLPAPTLSVWLAELTSESQAWVLVGSNPKNRVYVRLSVDAVRSVFADGVAGQPSIPPLDVVWERAMIPDPTDPHRSIPETRPGWEGHCGILGLSRGTPKQRGDLRLLLAEKIQPGDLVILTDEQLAAFQASA